MSVVAFLLAASATSPAIAVLPNFSRPIESYSCVLHDHLGNAFPLSFTTSGGQMVLTDDGVGYTDRLIKIDTDANSLFADLPDQYSNLAENVDGKLKHGFGWRGDQSFRYGLYVEGEVLARRATQAVLTIHDGLQGDFAAAGICEYAHEQQPLLDQRADSQ